MQMWRASFNEQRKGGETIVKRGKFEPRNAGPHPCRNPDCDRRVEIAGRVCSGACLTKARLIGA